MHHKIEFDKDDHGILIKMMGGCYRFRIESYDDSNDLLYITYGWRVAPDGISILSPASITKSGGVFMQGSMSPIMQKEVIAKWKTEKEASDNIAESKASYERAKKTGR